MGERLARPPLIEAICEFRFDPGSPWDWTIPGRLFDKIGDEFPERAQVNAIGIEVQLGPRVPPVPHILSGPERVQLKRADGSAMIQLGPNLLAVNHLRPYANWESFRDLILRVLRLYHELSHPGRIQRIGLRYINHIEVPAESPNGRRVLTVQPQLAGPLARPLAGFYQRYELSHERPPGTLIHQTGIQDVDARRVAVLDLDFGSEQLADVSDFDAVTAWLDAAHARIEESFLASVTQETLDAMRRGDS